MVRGDSGSRRALVVAGAVLALAVGACGDAGDDKSSSGGGGSDTESVSYQSTREGSDRDQIASTMHYLRDRFNAQDGEAFCAKLTESGRQEMLKIKAVVGGSGCAGVMAAVVRAGKTTTPSGQRPVHISSIKVNGDTAVVRARGGITGTTVAPLRLHKENGEWKLIEIGTKKKFGA